MSPDPISPSTARRSVWDDVFDVHHLVDRPDLGVVEMTVPVGASGKDHQHTRSREFFRVLRGTLTLSLGSREVLVQAGSGIEITAGTRHQVRNDGTEPVQVLVISSPRVADSSRRRSRGVGPQRGDARVVGTHLRRTRSGDLPDVVAFEEARDTSQFLGQGGLDWHRHVLGDPDMEHWVLVDRLDRVVAFGILAGLSHRDSVEVRRTVVAPAGRGQGLGRLLLRKLLEQALASPTVSRIWLDVSADNARARSLYRTYGFVEQPAPPDAVVLDDGIYMVLTR